MLCLPIQLKYGDKTNVEYSWTGSLPENILHFFSQLIRPVELVDLERHISNILNMIQQAPQQYKAELIILYQLIGYTRDIHTGLGEGRLSYMQILVWYSYYPKLAIFVLTQFVQGKKYGSWKDIKKICKYVKEKTNDASHPLIETSVKLMGNQLLHDAERMTSKKTISLAAKWAPREKNRAHRYLYDKLALYLYPQFIKTATNDKAKTAAFCKAKIYLRKKLSQMNRYLGTLENIMCNGQWQGISPASIPSNALFKYRLALQNKTTQNTLRSNKADRHICAGQFQYYIENNLRQASTVPLEKLVKAALQCTTEIDKNIINHLWAVDRKKNTEIKNTIALVDTSSSMEQEEGAPLYKAIGLGIRVSELSTGAFKHRLLVFSAKPTWVIFEEGLSFTDKVELVHSVIGGMNSNIQRPLEVLIKAFLATELSPCAVQNLTLGIFSDMQMDQFSKYNPYCLYDNIKNLFLKSGFKKIPKILFWNVRKTSGFPMWMYEKNAIMLSGSNTKLFNRLSSKAPAPRVLTTPPPRTLSPSYNIMLKCLDTPRYRILANKIISKT